MIFADRTKAGEMLADKLTSYQNQKAVVYALPRGGVMTALPIAKKLQAPLDLIIARKIVHPNFPEYAIGAVAENGHLVLNEDEVSSVSSKYLQEEIKKQRLEAKRRRQLYLKGRKPLSPRGKIAILVDDGVATGYTLEVGIQELKHQKPKKLILAVPVAPRDIAIKLGRQVDSFVAVEIPKDYAGAVGAYYASFPQVSDEEVIDAIKSVHN